MDAGAVAVLLAQVRIPNKLASNKRHWRRKDRMAGRRSVIPLIALDAVVIDTEPPVSTRARPGSWKLQRCGWSPVAYSRTLHFGAGSPRCPDPELATGIHGIDDAAVADAPAFADIWPELSAFIGGAVVIGHALGFDLAVLKRECERAGIGWTRPHTLDTRLLAEVAEPDLAAIRSTAWPPGSVSRSPIAIARSATRWHVQGFSSRSCRSCARWKSGRWRKPSEPVAP